MRLSKYIVALAISAILILNFSVAVCFQDAVVSRWLGMEGLLIDLFGAVLLIVPEFKWAKKHLGPNGLYSAKEQFLGDIQYRDRVDERTLEPDDEGFVELVNVLDKNTGIPGPPENIELVSMDILTRFADHSVFVDDGTAELEACNSLELGRWIDQAIQSYLRPYFTYGVVFLTLGLGLQAYSYYLTNF